MDCQMPSAPTVGVRKKSDYVACPPEELVGGYKGPSNWVIQKIHSSWLLFVKKR